MRDGAASEIESTSVDGVPTFWAPVSDDGPPFKAALTFRVGRADEELAWFGLTHIVEHLAMFAVGRTQFESNAFVDDFRTTFFAAGERDEVTGFLHAVTAALGALPLERLDSEKRVLETESSGAGPSLIARLLAWRCGVRGFGLAKYREMGLQTATAERVEAWARERFTRDNGALWVAGDELPGDLTLDLGSGRRFPAPPLEPLPQLRLPAHVEDGTGGVAVGAVAERGFAAMIGLAVASDRLHQRLRIDRALTYGVATSYDVTGAETAHTLVVADCLDEHAAEVRGEVVDTIHTLAQDGPTAAEVDEQRAFYDRGADSGGQTLARLDAAVRDELLGRPWLTSEELREEFHATEPSDVAAAVEGMRASMLVIAPEGVPNRDPRLSDWGDWDGPPPVEGRVFRRRGLRRGPMGDLTLGDEGLTLEPSGEGTPITIRYDDCVLVTTSAEGAVMVHGVEDSYVRFVPAQRRDGEQAVELLREHIPEWKWVAAEEGAAADVEAAAGRWLKRRWVVTEELKRLPDLLAPGEQVLALAESTRGVKAGLLFVTDRRIAFLHIGRKETLVDVERDQIERATEHGLMTKDLVVHAAGERHKFGDIVPRANVGEIVALIDKP